MATRSIVFELWVNGRPYADPDPDMSKVMGKARNLAKKKRSVSVVRLVIDEHGNQRVAPVTVASWYDGQEDTV